MTRIIAWSPKSGTYLNRAVRTVLGGLMPEECLWFSEGEWGDSWSERSKAAGPVVPGVVDYRMVVTLRDPFKLIVSTYHYFGLIGREGGLCNMFNR
jgi:hypothetical protein